MTSSLDGLNQLYFNSLLQEAHASTAQNRSPLRLYDPRVKDPERERLAYSAAIAPPELSAKIPVTSYQSLRTHLSPLTNRAKNSCLWIKKMQAGTGSSLERKRFLAETRHQSLDQICLGAKGTDLTIEIKKDENSRRVSLAEIQLLQAIHDHSQKIFGEVCIHDLVSDETLKSVEEIWNLPSWLDSKKTYLQIFSQTLGLSRSGRTIQAMIPTLDESRRISFNRKAPGGHALFAVDALRAAYLPNALPKTKLEIVSVIGNGEDLSSAPDAWMVDYMLEKKLPIVMITTDKTPIDLKGGQISLVREPDGEIYVSIVEQAQAKEAGQLELFEQLGLKVSADHRKAMFNTNMALFNYGELVPRMIDLVNSVGETEFLKIIAPDLISNWKEQTDSDGIVRKYLQLEGAMGSTLLNLDRYWRKKFHEPLVSFINVEQEYRTQFFSPIKTAFDFLIQFHSDRFALDPKSMRLKNLNPKILPSANFEDKFYQDVANILEVFKGSSLKDLVDLHVKGLVDFSGVKLKGKVKVVNPRPTLQRISNGILENQEVVI